MHNDIKKHVGEMHAQAEKNRRELSQIYNLVREILLEREQNLKRQISENLIKEEQESDDKIEDINCFMGRIMELKQEMTL